MRADDDVGKITQATPILVSCALEQFLKALVENALLQAQLRGAKKLSASHLKAAINASDKFDFLKDIVANVPDPIDTAAAANPDDFDNENPPTSAASSSASNAPAKKKRKRSNAPKQKPQSLAKSKRNSLITAAELDQEQDPKPEEEQEPEPKQDPERDSTVEHSQLPSEDCQKDGVDGQTHNTKRSKHSIQSLLLSNDAEDDE
ncbi:hypothetical protein HK100_005061 [Physocladia obscura]|uniref:Transcription factor CBF/NF-Y/archaeal histone domain-containing protein n=1 Tax=Physocladia obscura TaxID=109957 RepID=A0AAD5SUK7_9FUNG|nr:hypothetical protein HK100_005061 [Physocladia obscura]